MADKNTNHPKNTGLQKIESLLKQMGISEETTKEFITVCENWYTSQENKVRQEFQTRLEKAKKACIEEVESHKASLSRGLKVFLENQLQNIRKASEKRAAIAESEATDKLSKIVNLLNGLNVDSAVNAQALQAESKKNADLVNKVAELTEAVQREKAKTAKLSELSEKSISRQKDLEKQLTRQKGLLGEAREALRKEPSAKRVVLKEHKTQAGKPVSARKSTVAMSDKPVPKKNTGSADNDIDVIAASLG